ncbi:MAG TPA: hypothetical protein VHC98_02305 [Candidatus Saccharimonadales bacterium]|nr:hypothetical protein [Candidatus Saccharimonadales bacterium]
MERDVEKEQVPHPRTDPVRLRKLYVAEHRPSYDQKWQALADRHPGLVRQALVGAQRHRERDSDAGDAYLEGVADTFTALNRYELIDSLGEFYGVSDERLM